MKDDYDRNSTVQRAIVEVAQPMLSFAGGEIPRQATVTIVDYGASEGANSVLAVDTALRAVWTRHPDQHVCVIHNDQPKNNFNRLFENIYEKSATDYSREAGGGNETPRLFVFASGCTFYDQMSPHSSVDLGFSSSAAHWLSTMVPLKHHVYMTGAEDEERDELARVAAQDWQRFLLRRASELKPGARLIVSMAGRFAEDGDNGEIPEPFKTETTQPPEVVASCTVEPVLELLNGLLAEMVVQGEIEAEAYESFGLPLYSRDLKELTAPILDRESPLSRLFELEHAWVQAVPDPMLIRYNTTGDLEAYASAIVDTVRAFTEPVFVQGFFGEFERRKSQRELLHSHAVMEALYGQLKAEICSAPNMYPFNPINSYLMLRRRNG